MAISLTPEQEEFVRSQLTSGRYATVEALITAAFQLVSETEAETMQSLQSEHPGNPNLQEAWARWFAEVDALKPLEPEPENSEYPELLLEKYRQQGLIL